MLSIDNQSCSCAAGYGGKASDSCFSGLSGCAPVFKVEYIIATVIGIIVICVVLFLICYFRTCRDNRKHIKPVKENRLAVEQSKNKDTAVYTLDINTTNTTNTLQTNANTATANTTKDKKKDTKDTSETNTTTNDKDNRRATLPSNLHAIMPARYKVEGQESPVPPPAPPPDATGTANSGESSSMVELSEIPPPPPLPQAEAKMLPRPPPVDPNHLPIFYGEVQYRAIKLLGQGNFGRAYLVTNEKGKQMVIKTQWCTSRDQIEEANQEAQVLMQFKSEHLLEISDVFPEGAQELCLAINFCSGGTLADQVCQPNSVEEVVRIVKELCKGLSVLHAKRFIHRDIKPDNIFLADKDSRKVVIGDMGMARQVDATGYYSSTFGHTLYKAPEIAQSKFSWRSDMWACGCVLLELLSHTPIIDLYNTRKLVLGVLSERELSTTIASLLPNLVGTSVFGLVVQLLSLDPDKRPTADHVVQWDLQKEVPVAPTT